MRAKRHDRTQKTATFGAAPKHYGRDKPYRGSQNGEPVEDFDENRSISESRNGNPYGKVNPGEGRQVVSVDRQDSKTNAN